MIEWFAVRNAVPDLINEFTDWPSYVKFIGFPFKTLGLAALLILFLMAATSHDFWLAFLTPPAWKALHMALYVAYGLVVIHVSLGIMQGERTWLIPAMLIDLLWYRHGAASRRRLARARARSRQRARRWLDCGRFAAKTFRTGPRASSRRRAASASRCSATAMRSPR